LQNLCGGGAFDLKLLFNVPLQDDLTGSGSAVQKIQKRHLGPRQTMLSGILIQPPRQPITGNLQ
jgi:hypothetical protein